MEEENRELLLLLSRVGNFNFQLRFRFQIARLDLENLGKKFRWNFSRPDYFSILPLSGKRRVILSFWSV